MATFTISKWFAVEADNYEDAWALANASGVELAQEAIESGTIDVECIDEEDEGYDDDTHGAKDE